MPLVEVTLGAGRSPQQVRSMIHQVHDAIATTLGAQRDHIRIIVREVPRTHWATGDLTHAEMDSSALGAEAPNLGKDTGRQDLE